MTRKLREAIRKYCGAERIRVVSSVGVPTVYAYGSDDPANRDRDFWRYVGALTELIREVERDTEFEELGPSRTAGDIYET